MEVSLIAAVDLMNGLGKENQLLCHLPEDLKYFKRTTINKTIVMGYNTFASIGRALPGRKNIVVTHRTNLTVKNIEFVDSLEQAFNRADSKEVMVIGGASIYRQCIEVAHKIYLTRIHHEFAADVFFPEIDDKIWEILSEEYHLKDKKNPFDYSFMVYTRKAK